MKLILFLFTLLFGYATSTCMEARLEQQGNNLIGVFVPRCNEENADLYKRVQCHGSTGFCWCADEKDGTQIGEMFRLTDVGHLESLCD